MALTHDKNMEGPPIADLEQGVDKQGEANAKEHMEQVKYSAKGALSILAPSYSTAPEILSDKVEAIVAGSALSSTQVAATEEMAEKSQGEAKDESDEEKKSERAEDLTQANELEVEKEEASHLDPETIIEKEKGLIATFSKENEEDHVTIQGLCFRMNYATAVTSGKPKPRLEVGTKAKSTFKRPILKPRASPPAGSSALYNGWEIGVPSIGWETTLPLPCRQENPPKISVATSTKLKSTSKMTEECNTSTVTHANSITSSKPHESISSFTPVNFKSRMELRGAISNTHGTRLHGLGAIPSPIPKVTPSIKERIKSTASLKKERQPVIQREEEVKEKNMRKERQVTLEREEAMQNVKGEKMREKRQTVRERGENQQKAEENVRARVEEQQKAEEDELRKEKKLERQFEEEQQKTKEEMMRKQKNETNKKKKKKRKMKAKAQKAFNLPRLFPYYIICAFIVYLIFLVF